MCIMFCNAYIKKISYTIIFWIIYLRVFAFNKYCKLIKTNKMSFVFVVTGYDKNTSEFSFETTTDRIINIRL